MQSRKNILSRNNRKRSVKNSRKPSFASKLGAFILQGLNTKTKVKWSVNDGFSNSQPQVTGILPFLHINVTEGNLRALLRGSNTNHVRTLTGLCNDKNLNSVLQNVKFNCNRQSNNGISGFEQAIIDSINNSWNMRSNGRKHLATIEKHMRKQVELKLIPVKSIAWAN
jgi:hypothetical protein